MTDHDVITRLVDLHEHIKAPDTAVGADALRGKRMLRRRRTVLATAAAAAVVAVLGIAAVTTVGQQAGNRLDPVQPGPTPTGPPPTTHDWPLDRIRAEGTAEDETVTESGITTRAYVVCDGPRSACESDPPFRYPYQHAALEVAQAGRSSLFGLGPDTQHLVTAYGEDSVLVIDELPLDEPTGSTDARQLRYRLLRADGGQVRLTMSYDAVPALPGPGVLVIDDPFMDESGQHAYLVDEGEGTLRPLAVPRDMPGGPQHGSTWGPNSDQSLWFVGRLDCRVFWGEGDTFEDRDVCGDGFEGRWSGGDYAEVQADWFPDGWLRPSRMAVLEHNKDRLFLHVTLDDGATWQEVPVSGESAIPDALRQLG